MGLNDGLLVGYHFSNDLVDFSGNGNDGVPYSSSEFCNDKNGNPTSALSTDVNKSINIGNITTLRDLFFNANSKITISCWIKADVALANGWAMRFGTSGGKLFEIRIRNDSTKFISSGYVNSNDTDKGFYDTVYINHDFLNWTHFVFTFDNENIIMKTYIDNVLVNTVNTFTSGTFTEPDFFCLGNVYPGNPTYYLDGAIDEFRIYNRILSDTEINELYVGYNGEGDPPTNQSVIFL